MPPLYYMLKCYGVEPGTGADVSIETDLDSGWYTGARLQEDVPEPVECELVEPGEMLSMFTGGGLLMTRELVGALRVAGVDNLELFDAIIRDPETGRTWDNYHAVNIIGVISAADLAKSRPLERAGELIDVPFEGVAIDDARASGALMFRLAESVAGIVVHESVKPHIEAAGVNDMTFLQPSRWLG
jgi:hypothetical protein